jgi:hypothetical protein
VIYVAMLLALILAVLAIPFDIIFNIQRKESLYSEVAVRWLFGAVRFTIPGNVAQKPRKKPPKTKNKAKDKKKSAGGRTIKSLLWNARFRKRAIQFVKDFFQSIHIMAFYLRIRLGLDDPADTGRLWAVLGPLAVFLSSMSNTTVQLQPDFQAQALSLDSRGKVRIVPLQVIFTVLSFVFSPITIQTMWAAFKSSKK